MSLTPISDASPIIVPPDALGQYGTRRRRSSAFTAPLLAWLAVRRAATVHQVLSLWHGDARDPRHGWRVIGRMVGDGLLTSRPLDPELGAVSRHVLTIGPQARPNLPPSWRHPDPWSEPRSRLEQQLQRTHLTVLFGPEGWKWIPRHDVFDAIRQAGLRSYRGRALNGTDQTYRRRLEGIPPTPLSCDAMVQASTGDIMLVIEAGPHSRARVAIGRLPRRLLELAGRFITLRIAVLGADPVRAMEARAALERSIERHRLPLTVHPIPHFRELGHPGTWRRLEHSRYAVHGVQSPFPYRRPARNASQMAVGAPHAPAAICAHRGRA